MTNYEWLLQMGGEERQAWFDAEHVDANDALTRKGDVREDDVCANDANVAHDSREKLEADVYRAADEMEEFTHGEKFINTNKILRWLNRQAAITAEETSDAWEEYRDATQREIAELTAQVDELAQQLTNARADCEQYRELFSEAITLAAEIVNLQP